MSNHSFTLAAGASMQTRSSSAICAAVAAVALFSGTLVMLQLSAPPSASATPAAAPSTPIAPTAKTLTAGTWDLEPRWWGGNERRVEQPAPAAPAAKPTRIAVAAVPAVAESDLTFTKGYALRLAARQAAGQVVAIAPATEGKTDTAHPAVVARNTTAPARTGAAPTTRGLAPPLSLDASVEPVQSNSGSQTLAFDEPHGFAAPRGAAFPNLFGTLR